MNPPARLPGCTTTYLEMHSPAELQPRRCDDDHFWVAQMPEPQWAFNRLLYLQVGAAWAWVDKSAWTDEQWRAYVECDRLKTWAACYDDAPAGYYELRRDDEGAVEIAYFGLLPAFHGRGYGGALLTSAIEEAWRMQAVRVWVHTCTLDHPAALANYQARGMKIYHTEIRA